MVKQNRLPHRLLMQLDNWARENNYSMLYFECLVACKVFNLFEEGFLSITQKLFTISAFNSRKYTTQKMR